MIYTSGSTGRPKGVMVSHANVARLFAATAAWFRFGPGDVWTLFHSYAFDFSVWELWGALCHGGRVAVVSHQVSRSPDAFYALLARERVRVLNQTPSAFFQLAQAAEADRAPAHDLRLVIFGGEMLEPRRLRPWLARHPDDAPRLVNMYGITETTVHVTYQPIRAADLLDGAGSVIGRPIPDLCVYLLDRHQQLAPIGTPGELYIGGDGLARGYLGRPDLTAERFIPNPFAQGMGDRGWGMGTDSPIPARPLRSACPPSPIPRLYRTGDLARYWPDGTLEFLGRADDQVKVRGFRIEPGEVEAALVRHPALRDAAVVAREFAPGDTRLVAYVVPTRDPRPATRDPRPADADADESARAGEQTDSIVPPRSLSTRYSELIAFLREQLPDYMVPAAFVALETLPLTPSGKLDRRALPAPDSARPAADASFIAPRTAVEQELARIWAELLHLDRVGVEDNFFALGGHSLLVTQVAARARAAFQVRLPLRSLFEAPTIAGLAEHIEALRWAAQRSPQGAPDGDREVGEI